MADELNEGQFWLPPKLLSQDHDESEFHAELTKRLDQYTTRKTGIFQEQFPTHINVPWRTSYQKTDRLWNIATSPQSTLCNAMGGYNSKQASSRGSPNCLSPPYEEAKNMEATELLYAAAGEVTRLQQKPLLCPNQEFKQQKWMKKKQKSVQYMQQVQQDDETRNGNGFSPSAWPALKKTQFSEQPTPAGSGMKAVFLGNQITKSERSGTGVFLPRPAGSWNNQSPEIARKKPGYSTVLLPERVVQALNLNLGAIETPNQLNKNGFFHQQYDAALKNREHVARAHAQQRRDMARSTLTHNELQLPQEWTY
ncbi:hypothetical protein POM88_047899 [Heracleum sosnowskyi]|uniref:Uncharacterized protein n=1 Tax=Heracleum sosnowskyi TaxID=360622 RepID=A0AAD8GV79_9APIA|nr:hypothetical protein POM88_047899 [Heracleum sosnowskyi]